MEKALEKSQREVFPILGQDTERHYGLSDILIQLSLALQENINSSLCHSLLFSGSSASESFVSTFCTSERCGQVNN